MSFCVLRIISDIKFLNRSWSIFLLSRVNNWHNQFHHRIPRFEQDIRMMDDLLMELNSK